MKVREAIRRKNLLPFGNFPKGGGVISESKLTKKLLCSDHVWTFFLERGGGVALFQTFGGTFLLEFGRGGVTWFQKVWGTFLLEFGHFSVRAPDSKDDEELFLLWFRQYPRKIWEDDKNPNILRNFNSYKIRFKKSSLKDSKNKGGGVKAVWKNSKQEQIFFFGWLP